MKKNLFFTIALASLSYGVFAQLPVSTAPQNKTAYIEEFTGIHCGYCPDGHRIGSQIYTADPTKVVLVNIHSGSFANPNSAGDFDFRTTEGTAIDGMSGMGITGYPAGNVNRKVLVGSVMAAGRGNWTSMANTIKAQSAYCNVAAQGTLDPQTRVLTVDVEVYYTGTSPVATNSLNVFLLEDKIAGPQSNYGTPVLYNIANYNANGTYNHNHVLRKALTPTFGMTIPNTSNATLFTTTLTYTIPATYGVTGKTTIPNFENLELVAFVTQTDRDVINAANGPISMSKDVKAISTSFDMPVCGNLVTPKIVVKNNGLTTITDLTITPSVDAAASAATIWNGSIASGASATISLNNISNVTGGGHTFSYVIAGDNFTANNSGSGTFYVAADFQGTPVAEGFVNGTFPPASWGVNNSDNGPSWSRVTNAGGFNNSIESTKYNFFSNTSIGDVDELYLPPMDLSGGNPPDIAFDYAYAQKTSNNNDKLELLMSSDCGANWTTVFSASGSALSPTGLLTGSSYVPDVNDVSHWGTFQSPVTGFNLSSVIAKFVVTNDNGNNLYIDNINLSQSSPTGISKLNESSRSINIYPNPSSTETTLRIVTDVTGKQKISVVNTLGQVVYQKQMNLNAGSNNIVIDVRELAAGVYNVVVDSNNGSTVKKLTVTK